MAHQTVEDLERFSFTARLERAVQSGDTVLRFRAAPEMATGEELLLDPLSLNNELVTVVEVHHRDVTITPALAYDHDPDVQIIRKKFGDWAGASPPSLALPAGAGETEAVVTSVPATGSRWVVIEPYSTDCEVRQIQSIAGNTVQLAALASQHPAGAKVFFLDTLRVSPRWFLAAGDGVTDDTTALQAALDAVSPWQGIVDLGGDTYLVSSELDASDTTLHASGATIRREDGANAYVMAALGSIGAYQDLTADATAGSDSIVCAALAAQVAPGDLIKITSDVFFDTAEDLYQGEMAIVRSVSGATIRLKTRLWDSYTMANGAAACKVEPVSFNVTGRLTLENRPLLATDTVSGLRLQYTLGAHIESLIVKGTTQVGVRLDSCYGPRVNAEILGDIYTGSSSSYGLNVINSTMYGVFSVTALGHRHAISTGGNQVGRGVCWGIKYIDCIGSGLLGVQIFDAHGGVGDVEFNNCTAYGGLIDGSERPWGFGVGSRYCRIINCRAVDTDSAVNLRANVVVTDLIIRDLELINVASAGIFFNQTGASVANLIIDGVRGYTASDEGEYYAVRLAKVEVGAMSLHNIHVTRGGILKIDDETHVTVPALIEIRDCRCTGPTTPDGTAVKFAGVYIDNTNVTRLRVLNTGIASKDWGIYLVSPLTHLELLNCHFAGNYEHVRLPAGSDVDNIYIRGGSYIASTHGEGTRGIINYLDAIDADLVHVDGIRTDEIYIIGSNGGALVGLIGVNDLPAGFVNYTRQNSDTRLDVLSGARTSMQILSGYGDPEGVVTAPIGSLFLRRNGSTNTTMWVKESGTGNTGWVAK